ncbi:MAG: hypothetical protein JST50_10045 [Bacteroidetes bacterium]|jgi:hypothetical protein|nr:hypothetical protein [Bacteroidota bacterium]
MGKWLLMFGLFILIAAIACVRGPEGAESDSSADAKLGGGSLHIDSFRATSTGVTGSTASKYSTVDTPKNNLSSPYIADSLNKKKQ